MHQDLVTKVLEQIEDFKGVHSSDLEAIDTLDAVIMNGDTFVNMTNIRVMKRYLARWVKQLQEHEELCKQMEIEDYQE